MPAPGLSLHWVVKMLPPSLLIWAGGRPDAARPKRCDASQSTAGQQDRFCPGRATDAEPCWMPRRRGTTPTQILGNGQLTKIDAP
eukprot:1414656-Lingulodinium_polyedra.AAC.1